MTDEKFLKKLGERISEVRKSKGFTQKQLAKILGTHYTGIVRIENGRINSSVLKLKQISEALDCSLEELIVIK